MADFRHTLMREDVSMENARDYGSTRDSTTIWAALSAIASRPCLLMLMDEEGGVWTLSTDVSIPANVTLCIPSGVTLQGSGNLTILGGLLALRGDWWQSSGVLAWDQATVPLLAPLVQARALDLTQLGASAVRLEQAPGSTPWQLTLPPGPGTVNQVLRTDGQGVTTWVDVTPADATLAALAALTPGPDTYIYFTGTDQATTGLISPLARTFVSHVTPQQMRTTMQLGSLATLSSVTTTELTDRAVTYPKIQNVTGSRLLGNPSGTPGSMQEITLGVGLAFQGTAIAVTGSAYMDSPVFLHMGG